MAATRRFRFSLRTLFAVVFLVAAAAAIVTAYVRSALRQRALVVDIMRSFGSVSYDFNPNRSGTYDARRVQQQPSWLAQMLGDDFVSPVYSVYARAADDDMALQIATLSKLRGLDLANTDISDRGLSHLARLSELRDLNLSGTAISDDGLSALHDMTELRRLQLSRTRITAQGLMKLSHLTNLETLAVYGTSIGDESAPFLSGFPELQALHLSFTDLSDAGLDVLPKLKRLREVSLDGTQVSLAGFQRLKAALSKDCEVSFAPTPSSAHRDAWLTLQRNDVAVRYEWNQQNTSQPKWYVNLLGQDPIPSELLSALKQIQNLEGLSISYCVLNDEARSTITELQLRQLNLMGTKLSAADLKMCSELSSLKTLALPDCRLRDDDLAFLSRLNSLRELVLDDNPIGERALELLSTLENIEYLGLNATAIDSAALEQLKGCRNLKTLLLKSTAVDDTGLQHLYGLTQLRKLSLKNTKVTPSGVEALRRELPQLRVLQQQGESW